jgi:hypothetical protein
MYLRRLALKRTQATYRSEFKASGVSSMELRELEHPPQLNSQLSSSMPNIVNENR